LPIIFTHINDLLQHLPGFLSFYGFKLLGGLLFFLALFGLILLTVRVGQIMNKEKISLGKRLSLFLMVLFLMNAFFSIRIDALLHWAPARADIALYYSRLFRENKEICQKGVYFTGSYSKEIATVLSFADGPRYFCQDYSLPVFYQGINEPPAGQEGVLFKIRTEQYND